jgi:serine/threonine-protein phosphatase 6 regulatory ankyrin repeat subunit B
MKSCDLSNNEKYEALQSAQRFFGKCIEHVMGGDVKSLKSMFEVFQRENPLLSQIDIVENFRSEGKTFLHIAASSGCADVFNYIAKYASVDIMDSEDDHGYTPLINATACGNTEIVEFLLKKGARINHQNKDGASALHFAASEGSTHLLNLLLQRGADLNLLSQDAGTALHWAAGKAKIEAINVLVRHGALVNIKNRSDITPVIL